MGLQAGIYTVSIDGAETLQHILHPDTGTPDPARAMQVRVALTNA